MDEEGMVYDIDDGASVGKQHERPVAGAHVREVPPAVDMHDARVQRRDGEVIIESERAAAIRASAEEDEKKEAMGAESTNKAEGAQPTKKAEGALVGAQPLTKPRARTKPTK